METKTERIRTIDDRRGEIRYALVSSLPPFPSIPFRFRSINQFNQSVALSATQHNTARGGTIGYPFDQLTLPPFLFNFGDTK